MIPEYKHLQRLADLVETTISIHQRVRDIRQGPYNLPYVLTNERNGELIQPKPTEG